MELLVGELTLLVLRQVHALIHPCRPSSDARNTAQLVAQPELLSHLCRLIEDGQPIIPGRRIRQKEVPARGVRAYPLLRGVDRARWCARYRYRCSAGPAQATGAAVCERELLVTLSDTETEALVVQAVRGTPAALLGVLQAVQSLR
ncbi:hypothetical protein OG289_29565 [Streptomyces sp. NBC_01235]|nr:hypothetical protein OG289_29565 [Streptomyces sp. NBC_01235]